MACCLTAPSHYLNQSWFSFVMFCGICLTAISLRVAKLLFPIMRLKIMLLRLLPHFPRVNELTHWDRVTHICVGKLTIIGSDNGLSPGRRQAIIRTNAGILLIRPLGTNFSDFLVEILIFSFKKMRLKVSSAKRRPFCLGLNELIIQFHGTIFGGKKYYIFIKNINGKHFVDDVFTCIFIMKITLFRFNFHWCIFIMKITLFPLFRHNFHWKHNFSSFYQSRRSPKVVALFLLQTLVAIWYDFFNCMIQSKRNQIIQKSTIIIII